MKNTLLSIFVLLFPLLGSCQIFGNKYTTIGAYQPHITDACSTSDSCFIVSFDLPGPSWGVTAGIMKLNYTGDTLWTKLLNLPSSSASCSFEVKENNAGNYLILGLSVVPTGITGFLAEFDLLGNVNWCKEYNTLDSGGGYSPNKLYEDSEGDLYIMLSLYSSTYTLKTNSTGEILWGRKYTSDSISSGKAPGFDIEPLQDGGTLMACKTDNAATFVRYGPTGTTDWIRIYELDFYSHIKSLVENDLGEVFAFGFTTPASLEDKRPIILEIDPLNGDLTWVKTVENMNVNMWTGEMILDGSELLTSFTSKFGSIAPVSYEAAKIRFDFNGDVIHASKTDSTIQMGYENEVFRISSNDYLSYGSIADLTDSSGYIYRESDALKYPCIGYKIDTIESTVFSLVQEVFPPYFEANFLIDTNLSLVTNPISFNENTYCSSLSLIEKSKDIKLNVYPNPSHGNFQIELDQFYPQVKVTVTDVFGRIMYSEDHLNINQFTLSLDMPTGLYLFNATSENSTTTTRLIVSQME
jgi:hypothetical protein